MSFSDYLDTKKTRVKRFLTNYFVAFNYLPHLLEDYSNGVVGYETLYDVKKWMKGVAEQMNSDQYYSANRIPQAQSIKVDGFSSLYCIIVKFDFSGAITEPLYAFAYIDIDTKKTALYTLEYTLLQKYALCGVGVQLHLNFDIRFEQPNDPQIVFKSKELAIEQLYNIEDKTQSTDFQNQHQSNKKKTLDLFGQTVFYNGVSDEIALNNNKAVVHFNQLIKEGNIDAYIDLYTVYWINMQNYEKAVNILIENSTLDHPSVKCLWNLGVLYLQGDIIPNNPLVKNIERAKELFEKIISMELCSSEESRKDKAIKLAKELITQIGHSNFYNSKTENNNENNFVKSVFAMADDFITRLQPVNHDIYGEVCIFCYSYRVLEYTKKIKCRLTPFMTFLKGHHDFSKGVGPEIRDYSSGLHSIFCKSSNGIITRVDSPKDTNRLSVGFRPSELSRADILVYSEPHDNGINHTVIDKSSAYTTDYYCLDSFCSALLDKLKTSDSLTIRNKMLNKYAKSRTRIYQSIIHNINSELYVDTELYATYLLLFEKCYDIDACGFDDVNKRCKIFPTPDFSSLFDSNASQIFAFDQELHSRLEHAIIDLCVNNA